MSLFRRLPPDCLLEISERVYVFDCCLSNDVMGDDEYTLYLVGVASQLQDHFPEASSSVLVSSFGEQRSQISDVLSHYNITVMNYPCHYKSCPLLPLEVIHHFLKLSESWLSSSFGGQQNVLLLHCERGAWPLLAFMLSGLLLLYRRKQYPNEEKTLELVYKQAPKELLHLSSPLNPHPSQLRYLHYITTRNLASDWLPLDTPLLLDCLILRDLPHFEGREGCRPIVRVYGQDPGNRSILVFSTPKIKKHTHLYQQEECKVVKLDIKCRVQGDVVLECIHLHDALVREEMVFRIMFHTAFVSGNVLIVQCDEMDVLWDAMDQFPKEFKTEVHFSGADAMVPSILTAPVISDDSSKEFLEVEEIFSNVIDGPDHNTSSHGSKGDVEPNAFLVSNHKYDMHAETSTDRPPMYGPSPLPPLPTGGVREHGAPPPPPPPPPLKPGKPLPPPPIPPMKPGNPPPPPPPPGYRWPRVPPPPMFRLKPAVTATPLSFIESFEKAQEETIDQEELKNNEKAAKEVWDSS